MMAEKGMDHASRRKKYCVAMEQGIRRDGKSLHREAEKGLFRAGNYELRGRKL